jgi:hypothetical protein
MMENTENRGGRRGSRWRIAAWATAAILLLLPLFPMQVTNEVAWDLADFVFAGVLIVGVGVAYELTVRMTDNTPYRAAVAVVLAAAFILIWINLAVGIIGTEDNPANLMYGGVLVVGFIGAVIARFRPDGLARALFATALAQAVVAAIALIAGMQSPVSPAIEILGLNGFFAALWLGSAWLFRKAAREQAPPRRADL